MRDAFTPCPTSRRRIALALVQACGPLLLGCMPIPILLPNLSHSGAVKPVTPPGPSGSESGEVRAFRVDVTERYVGIGMGHSETRCLIREIPLSPSGAVPPQTAFSFDRGVFIYAFVGGLLDVTFDDMAVRLYRPGYKTVHIAPQRDATPVRWHPALHWGDQEMAVDRLLQLPSENNWQKFGPWTPDPPIWGWATGAQRQALLFAAGEYERIADALPPDASPEDRARLNEKSSKLRRAAERPEKSTPQG